MERIRYGLIGCGMMGREHIRNIALLDDATVAAIFEPDPEMRAQARVLAPTAVFYEHLGELLADARLDALVIVSPNDCHLDQLEQVKATRPLPVLVEKPLFTDPADLPRLAAFRKDYPAPIWVAMEYRYMPPVAALAETVDSVTGGIRMLSLREHRFPFLDKVGGWNQFNARTGGTLVEKCCHFFDLMRFLLRDEPVRVMASGGQSVNRLGLADVWDNAYVIVDFAGGARALLDLCMFAEGAEYQEEITAVGPLGKVQALVPGPGRFWPETLGPAPTPKLIVSPRHPKGPKSHDIPVPEALLDAGDHNGSTFYQHQRFLDVVRGRAAPEVGFDDGLRAVLMGQAAQLSALEGRAVTLDMPPLSASVDRVKTPEKAV
ncbi:Gfo/Idh/MocA family protein [Meridianimarinicoccus aquatilis]|uniref:Gfo/Idh/MocA family oxidoreductase n=1 Tax=Meridianimarinicoccus aquatilis TaxID=2552766 RepID=A0A4R6B375_9RHOB|nr:Gfo/Idh/MocA family oxidoreductase [Fluviibacterium aquatile]TDL90752.1 Gfo/Idh/MocA family oxidoreductase [Fluviibacterium aquatile]